jgi:deaminated glutathione amidase
MVVDPWGVVACELGGAKGGPEIATAEIDSELLKKARREMPLARRT